MEVNDQKLSSAQQAVIKLFEGIYPLSNSLQTEIRENSHLLDIPQKTKILNIGEVQKSIYFIIEGAVRTYYIDKKGNQNTSWLLFEQELAISVFSFFSQKPSFEILETLEASSLLVMSHSTLQKLYREYVEFNVIGRVITEKYYIRSEEKANELRMLSARERYASMMKNERNILPRVPLGIIASYLGMTQSTLSRIRATKS